MGGIGVVLNPHSKKYKNKLELNDIETAFACPIRIYKSGKYYLVRVNVKVNYNTNIPSIKIYNENELPITIDDVTSENYMISILEIQGIKFTSRNFQIEMELKQAMVLSSEKIFESCLIKTSLKTVKPQEMQSENIVLKENAVENLEESELVLETQTVVAEENQPEPFSESPNIEAVEKHDIVESVENKIEDTLKNEDNLDLNLTEVNLDSDLENLETITLKKPNQVYYEIYKTARKKAKDAKRTAIMAFLEAKNIKKTYMLDDLDDSEDSEDSDMDIEDMSEEDLDSDLEKEVSED